MYLYSSLQVDNDVWIYYMVELSFYWSLSISQFFDVRRKDFWEMFIHHNTTIALMMFSWTAHFTRIGTLVLIVHDCADHLLELAKLCKYTKYQVSTAIPIYAGCRAVSCWAGWSIYRNVKRGREKKEWPL